MEITASLVKDLREKTGVGMMDCKKALEQTSGNFEEAVKYLREKGLAAAAKKSDRETREGKVFTQVASDGSRAAIVEVSCETDFVANNESFAEFGLSIAAYVLESSVATTAELEAANINGRSVREVVSDAVLKLGENISIRRIELLSGQSIGSYVHSNGKIGVVVSFDGPVTTDISKDIAMHIAAQNPQCVRRDEVASAEIDREAEIIKAQARNEGKPEAVLEKLVSGKIGKFYKDVCLLEQDFVKDPSRTVATVLPEGRTVTQFVRFSLG
ncbi:elongation factor Ts [bacterium]|nr:elongation factor Ts [bacterium]